MSNIVREYLDEEDIKEALRDYLRHNRAYVIIQGLRPAHVELKYDAKTREISATVECVELSFADSELNIHFDPIEDLHAELAGSLPYTDEQKLLLDDLGDLDITED